MNQPTVETQQVFYTATQISAPLPSLGKIYPQNSPLYNKEFIEIREMAGPEEDILTSPSLLRNGISIDTVLKNCILDKSINIEDLLLGDRNSVIISLILASYGTSYKVDVSCPECNEKTKQHGFNLSKLSVKNLETDPIILGENKFLFTLPKSKINVNFKLLTRKDDIEIKNTVEKYKKATNETKERFSTTRLKWEILSINDTTDKNKINSFIDSTQFPIADTTALRNYIDSISPDIITEQEFKCNNCGETSNVKIPITFEFFWRGGKY